MNEVTDIQTLLAQEFETPAPMQWLDIIKANIESFNSHSRLEKFINDLAKPTSMSYSDEQKKRAIQAIVILIILNSDCLYLKIREVQKIYYRNTVLLYLSRALKNTDGLSLNELGRFLCIRKEKLNELISTSVARLIKAPDKVIFMRQVLALIYGQGAITERSFSDRLISEIAHKTLSQMNTTSKLSFILHPMSDP